MKKTLIFFVLSAVIAFMKAEESESLLNKYFQESILSSLTPQAPTGATLTRYGNHPVNMSNGLVPITIPLYQIESGSLVVPIQLSYHGGGIKLNEDETWVGLGWNLDFGGSITRTKNGFEDEREDFTSTPDGNRVMSMLSNKEDGTIDKCLKWVNGKYSTDSYKPDLFTYQFGQSSGTFFFNAAHDSVYTLSYEPIIYKDCREKGGHNLGRMSFFTTDGVRYIFGNSNSIEETKVINAQSGQRDLYESAYYIDAIISANDADSISYKYQEAGEYSKTFPSSYCGITFRPEFPEDIPGEVLLYFYPEIFNYPVRINPTNSSLYHKTKLRRPKYIYFRGGRITFVLKEGLFAATNHDCKMLDYILIEKLNLGKYSLVKKIAFNYTRDRLNRLLLESVDDIEIPNQNTFGHDVVQKIASFEYNDNFDTRHDKKSCDFWGYYNGVKNESLIPLTYIRSENRDVLPNPYSTEMPLIPVGNANVDRTPHEDAMRFGSLERIIYPTGGYTDFVWEANRVKDKPDLLFTVCRNASKSLFVSPESSVTCAPKPIVYSPHEEENVPTEVVSSTVIHSALDQVATITYSMSSKTQTKNEHLKYDLLRITVNGDEVARFPNGTVSVSKTITYQMKQGVDYEVCISSNCNNLSGSLSVEYVDATDESAGNATDGWLYSGLRIKEMNQFDSDGTLIKKTQYQYKNPEGICSGYFTTDKEWSFKKRQISTKWISVPIMAISTGDDPSVRMLCKQVSWMVYSDLVDGPSDGQLAYEYVTETVIDGKTEKTLSRKNCQYYKIMDKRNNKHTPVMNMSHLRGKELLVEEYKTDEDCFVLVRSTKNQYSIDNRINAGITGFVVVPHYLGSTESVDDCISFCHQWQENWTDLFAPYNYRFSTMWVHLDSQQIEERLSDGSYMKKYIGYRYENPEHAMPTEEETRLGNDCFIVRTVYSGDKNDTTSQRMKMYNMRVLPVSKYLYQKQQGVEVLQGGVQNDYDNNFLKTFVSEVLPSGQQRRLFTYKYDTASRHYNLIEHIGRDNICTSILWDTYDIHPVAVVKGMSAETLNEAMPSKNIVGEDSLYFRLFNDVRFKNTSIQTFTYHPDGNIKSITQPNGVTTYYEYDGHGRLINILDYRKNVLQRYFYNLIR